MKKSILFLVILLSSLCLSFTNKSNIIAVGVIDTGLDLNDPRVKPYLCPTGHHDFTGEGIQDTNGHGTHIAGLIIQNAKNANYCLVILKYYISNDGYGNSSRMIAALNEASYQKLPIVNISSNGTGFNTLEYYSIKYNKWTKFFVAAGNDGRNIDLDANKTYPASYDLPSINVVGNINRDSTRCSSSNFGNKVNYWEVGVNLKSYLPNGKIGYMTGTSMATAVHTGKYLNENY